MNPISCRLRGVAELGGLIGDDGGGDDGVWHYGLACYSSTFAKELLFTGIRIEMTRTK